MSPIERSAGGGGASASGLTLLFDSTLGVDTASLDTGANGIAAGHKDLVVYYLARTADVATNVNISMRLNNDAGANYTWSIVRNDGTNAANATSAIGATAAVVGQAIANNGPANAAGQSTFFVPAYDAVTFNKCGNGTSAPIATTNVQVWAAAWTWVSTVAITRMAIFSASGGNLKAGSMLRIYGTG